MGADDVERPRRGRRADRSLGRQTHMRNQDVRSGLGHGAGARIAMAAQHTRLESRCNRRGSIDNQAAMGKEVIRVVAAVLDAVLPRRHGVTVDAGGSIMLVPAKEPLAMGSSIWIMFRPEQAWIETGGQGSPGGVNDSITTITINGAALVDEQSLLSHINSQLASSNASAYIADDGSLAFRLRTAGYGNISLDNFSGGVAGHCRSTCARTVSAETCSWRATSSPV